MSKQIVVEKVVTATNACCIPMKQAINSRGLGLSLTYEDEEGTVNLPLDGGQSMVLTYCPWCITRIELKVE